MKPLQTILTIDSVGQRYISLEEGLERKNLSVVHKVDELPEEGQQGVIYYLQDTGEYIIFDSNGNTYNIYPNTPNLTGYVKYILCSDEDEYDAIENKDSNTLYLISEE